MRFPLANSSQWKIPPNIYSNRNDIIKPSMGKKGFFQCFTVERSLKTIRTHFPLSLDPQFCKTEYYDLTQGNLSCYYLYLFMINF